MKILSQRFNGHAVTGSNRQQQRGVSMRHNPPSGDAFVRFARKQELIMNPDGLPGKGFRYDEGAVVIIGGKRTPFADEALHPFTEADLGVFAAKGAIDAIQLPGSTIKDSKWGKVIPASAGTAFTAKSIATRLELPNCVTATEYNRRCGSGGAALQAAALEISHLPDSEADYAALVGGVESMTGAPIASFEGVYALGKMAKENPLFAILRAVDMCGAFAEDLVQMMRFKPPASSYAYTNTLARGLIDPETGEMMVDTGENVATRYGLTPEKLDRYSVNSQHLAQRAINNGWLAEEIVPICDPKTGKLILDADQHVRGGRVNEKSTAGLRKGSGWKRFHTKPENANHTSANTSRVVDGAGALLVTNRKIAKDLDKPVLAEVVAIAETGVNNHQMGIGAAQAAKVALKVAGLTLDDIAVIDVNEAFASVPLAALIELAQFDPGTSDSLEKRVEELALKTNVNGGAIALGHPLAATNIRQILNVMNELRRRNAKYGLVAACIGGGEGVAVIIRNPDYSGR